MYGLLNKHVVVSVRVASVVFGLCAGRIPTLGLGLVFVFDIRVMLVLGVGVARNTVFDLVLCITCLSCVLMLVVPWVWCLIM